MIIFFAAEAGKALYSQQKQDQEADCGSDHELLIAEFRAKLKKVGKTTRPFRYDLKGLDLIQCLKNYGQKFMTLYRRQGSRPSPRKRNTKKQNGCLRRTYK